MSITPLSLSVSLKIAHTLAGTGGEMPRSSQARRGERERDIVDGGERQNNIILKAITMNSPQFRHESAPLSLTRGKEMKEKGEKKGRRKRKTAH